MNYQERYYSYQTKARGLLCANSLRVHFEKLRKWYGFRLGKYLPHNLDARCLDVPCGYGNFLYFLKSKGYRNIKGYDLDENQIKLACLLDLPATKGDAFDVMFTSNGQYDLISSLDFIEHLTKDEALKFIDACKDKLSEGGVLILRTPCADGPFGAHDAWNDLTHQWGLTSNVLQTLLEMCGFVNVQLLDERPEPTSPLNAIRWLIFFPTRMLVSIFCLALGIHPPKIWTRSMMAVAYK
jgi:2-polyprenyl-3-methyl-5-hydroxy-6-metoxy-1,4-benzoquinol methylase